MAKKKKVEFDTAPYYLSALNNPMLNYRVYVMGAGERLLYCLLTFLVGGSVGLIFYGGLFKKEGVATIATYFSNLVIFCIAGGIVGKIFMPVIREKLRKKRLNKLKMQFRDFLAAFATSLSSGMNVNDSLVNAYNDLKLQYSQEALITIEVGELVNGIQNNINIEDMLRDFGERTGVDDILNFSIVFDTCYRTGGNLKNIIQRTTAIISEKMVIAEEIETKITSNKTQMLAMNIMPIVIMVLMKTMSPEFAESFASGLGVIAVTVAIGIFIGAYAVGQKIMDIKA